MFKRIWRWIFRRWCFDFSEGSKRLGIDKLDESEFMMYIHMGELVQQKKLKLLFLVTQPNGDLKQYSSIYHIPAETQTGQITPVYGVVITKD